MKMGLCQACGKVATQTCKVCGATVCIQCMDNMGCKICHGRKKI
ncbi:MAG: hypothetical protein ACE5J4_00915 [Candidatus Aenigmatarchaeota archaeon]